MQAYTLTNRIAYQPYPEAYPPVSGFYRFHDNFHRILRRSIFVALTRFKYLSGLFWLVEQVGSRVVTNVNFINLQEFAKHICKSWANLQSWIYRNLRFSERFAGIYEKDICKSEVRFFFRFARICNYQLQIRKNLQGSSDSQQFTVSLTFARICKCMKNNALF